MESVRIPANLISERLDARYNSPSAVAVRQKITSCGLPLATVGSLFAELVCGPFGSTITANEQNHQGEILLVQPTNINSDLFSLASSWRISERTLIEKSLSLYPIETFLFARVGIYPHVGVLPEWVGRATIGSSIIAGTPNGKVNHYYLHSFFKCKYGLPLLFAAQKVTAQPTIGTYEIESTIVPIADSKAQAYIGDKVRQAERLRGRATLLEKYFQEQIQNLFPAIFEDGGQSLSKQTRIDSKTLDGNLNPGAYSPERLRIRKAISECGGKQLTALATVETPTSSTYNPDDVYIGLDCIPSASCGLTPSTIASEKVAGTVRVLKEGVAISRLRPYLNKVAFIPRELSGAFGSTELLCVKPKGDQSSWFLYGVLKLQSTVKQLNPIATGSTHPRVSRDDILDLMIPWVDDIEALGKKLEEAQQAYFFSERLTQAAKLLVEALIEGKISEEELKQAQEALERGDNSLDGAILARLTRKGIDEAKEQPLFADLAALHDAIAQPRV